MSTRPHGQRHRGFTTILGRRWCCLDQRNTRVARPVNPVDVRQQRRLPAEQSRELRVEETHCFHAGGYVVAEDTAHRRRDRRGTWLANTPHGHTQVLRFDDNNRAIGI